MIDRLIWVAVRRFYFRVKINGFRASFKSYANGNTVLNKFCSLHGCSEVRDSVIGRYTYMTDARVTNADVGAFCSIGPGALVGGLGKHPTSWISTHPAFYSIGGQVISSFVNGYYFEEMERASIGNDVWIGARAIVLDGVSIGNGAIVAAGAIVVKDVEPYSIVAGVPARIIKKRFLDDDIDFLTWLSWWDWEENLLIESAGLFRSEKIDREKLCQKKISNQMGGV